MADERLDGEAPTPASNAGSAAVGDEPGKEGSAAEGEVKAPEPPQEEEETAAAPEEPPAPRTRRRRKEPTTRPRVPGRGEPLRPCRNKKLVHNTHPKSWSRTAAELRSFADRCEAGEITSSGELTRGIQQVRNLSGRATEGLFPFARALDSTRKFGLCESTEFYQQAAPKLARWAAELSTLFEKGLPVLQQGVTNEVFLTRRQCAALISAALFAALPELKGGSKFDLAELELGLLLDLEEQKVLCLVSYFWQVASADDTFLEQLVSFGRRAAPADTHAFWLQSDKPLQRAYLVEDTEEVEAQQAYYDTILGSAFVAGDLLDGGCSDEELRFIVSPECLVARLLCERMQPHEVLVITGAKQYSSCSGTGKAFTFEGPYVEDEDEAWEPDEERRAGPRLVVFGCGPPSGKAQYEPQQLQAELLKGYALCLGDPVEEPPEVEWEEVEVEEGEEWEEEVEEAPPPYYATAGPGWWELGGDADPQLKVLVQWLAASAAGKELRYCTMGDESLQDLQEVISKVWRSGATCSDLYKLLHGHKRSRGVFRGLLMQLELALQDGYLVGRPETPRPAPEPEEPVAEELGEVEGGGTAQEDEDGGGQVVEPAASLGDGSREGGGGAEQPSASRRGSSKPGSQRSGSQRSAGYPLESRHSAGRLSRQSAATSVDV